MNVQKEPYMCAECALYVCGKSPIFVMCTVLQYVAMCV